MSLSDYLSSPYLIGGIQNINSSINSPNRSKMDSYDQTQRLEKEFCKDFSCCGLHLDNLHELLEHYEEYHLSLANPTSDEDDIQQQALRNANLNLPHITHTNLNILENSHKSNPFQIQTMNTMMDGIQTPTLSPGSPTLDQSTDDDTVFYLPNKVPLSVQHIPVDTEDDSADKPYRCDVDYCDKAYKNANGLKYHRLHGHCPPNENELDSNKPFTCSLGNCRKRYKNLNGLKYHIEHTHMIKIALTSDMFLKNDTQESHGIKRNFSSTSLSSEA